MRQEAEDNPDFQEALARHGKAIARTLGLQPQGEALTPSGHARAPQPPSAVDPSVLEERRGDRSFARIHETFGASAPVDGLMWAEPGEAETAAISINSSTGVR